MLTDHCVEGNRWKSELTDASTGLSMIGKKPDDPVGSLGERLRDDPSQSLGEAPNDHDSGPTQESLCLAARFSVSRRMHVADRIVSRSSMTSSSSAAHWLRTKHSRRITRRNSRTWAQCLTTQLTDNSGRTQPSRMSRQQSSSTTSTGRKRSLQKQRMVRWTSLWRLRETSPGHTARDCKRCCTAARCLEKM